MSAICVFAALGGQGSVNVQLVQGVRATESLTIPATSSNAAQGYEVVIVVNTEATPILVAWGSTPDAAATASTSATTAGLPIPVGGSAAIVLSPGNKINAKATS